MDDLLNPVSFAPCNTAHHRIPAQWRLPYQRAVVSERMPVNQLTR